jgi:hypothetical protein
MYYEAVTAKEQDGEQLAGAGEGRVLLAMSVPEEHTDCFLLVECTTALAGARMK